MKKFRILCALIICIITICSCIVFLKGISAYAYRNAGIFDTAKEHTTDGIVNCLTNQVGINIGNSLDCRSSKKLASTTDYETYWGNPFITQELLNMIAKSGFGVVRIPVTWDQHMLEDGYTIDPDWMKRVHQVVDYAIDAGLYVILDTHHDEWASVDVQKLAYAEDMTRKIWGQIAYEFKDYDYQLVFEGFNELRISDDLPWNYRDEDSGYAVNKLNQTFINTVRNASGYNEDRILLISAFYNSCEKNDIYALDIDADKNIMLSVHLYAPYRFTGDEKSDEATSYWDQNDDEMVKTVRNSIDNLIEYQEESGIKVIVTEMGNVDKDNLESRINWINYTVHRLRDAGISYIWWDDFYESSDHTNYAIMDRNNYRIVYPEILNALVIR